MKKIILALVLLVSAGYVVAEDLGLDSLTENSIPASQDSAASLANGHATAAPAAETTAAVPIPEREAVFVDDNTQIVPKMQHEEDPQLHYTIDLSYPQIEGEHLTNSALQFNKQVINIVNQDIQKFKHYVAADSVHMKTLPEESQHNSLRIDYDIDVIKPNKTNIISVRFTNEGFQAGRAHPYHNHRVLNFDLTNGKILNLADLFKTKPSYLTVLSQLTSKKLNAKLADKWMIAEGTKPIDKNFQTWNLENDAILITFDEYQVAPYVNGTQEVEIPYSELKAVLSPLAVVSACAANPDSCEGSQTV